METIKIDLNKLFLNCLTTPDISFEMIRLFFPKKDDFIKNLDKLKGDSLNENLIKEAKIIILENMNEYFFLTSSMRKWTDNNLKIENIKSNIIDSLKKEYLSSFDFGILMLKIFDNNYDETYTEGNRRKWILPFRDILIYYKSNNEFNDEYFKEAIYYPKNHVHDSSKYDLYLKEYEFFLKSMTFYVDNHSIITIDDLFETEETEEIFSNISKDLEIDSQIEKSISLSVIENNVNGSLPKIRDTNEYKSIALELKGLFDTKTLFETKGDEDDDKTEEYDIEIILGPFGYKIKSKKRGESFERYVSSVYDSHLLNFYLYIYENSFFEKIYEKYKNVLFEKKKYNQIDFNFFIKMLKKYKKEDCDIQFLKPTFINNNGEIKFDILKSSSVSIKRISVFLNLNGLESDIKKIFIHCDITSDVSITFNLIKGNNMLNSLNYISLIYKIVNYIQTLRYPVFSFEQTKKSLFKIGLNKGSKYYFYSNGFNKEKGKIDSFYILKDHNKKENILKDHNKKENDTENPLNHLKSNKPFKKQKIDQLDSKITTNKQKIENTSTKEDNEIEFIKEIPLLIEKKDFVENHPGKFKKVSERGLTVIEKRNESTGIILSILHHYMESKMRKVKTTTIPLSDIELSVLNYYMIKKQKL